MLIYTYSTKLSSQPDSRGHSTRRTAFALAAVFEEFRPRDAAAIDHGGFVDRPPNEEPQPAPEAWRRETKRLRRIKSADLIRQEAA